MGFSFKKSMGCGQSTMPLALVQRDEHSPNKHTFGPQTAHFLSLSLNHRDFSQLVTVARVLIYQLLTGIAVLLISTLARSRRHIKRKELFL